LYFQVSPEEEDVFEEIENMLQDVEKKDTKCILPFPLLTTNAVESLRYRSQVWSDECVTPPPGVFIVATSATARIIYVLITCYFKWL
jgi:hypothetical protein